MVEIWFSPKPMPSAVCTWAMVRPSGASLARSTLTTIEGLLRSRSLVTSSKPGKAANARVTRPLQSYSAGMSIDCKVYWYCALDWRPPMRIAGVFWI